MGTLYECLMEVQLEKYYPSFISNGIARAETLTRLTPNEYGFYGITSTDERRRLYELISLLKSVFKPTGHSTTVKEKRRRSCRKRNHSPADANQSTKHEVSYTSAQQRARLPTSNTVVSLENAQNRNFSKSAYQAEVTGSRKCGTQYSPQPSPVFIEKVRHDSGYNYGLPNSKTKARMTSPKLLSDDRIKVCVRKRPLNSRELKVNDKDITMVHDNGVTVNETKLTVDLTVYTLQHQFFFDEVFEEDCSNEEVYLRVVKPLVEWIFNKGIATIFAYGQTGAGKTYTMMGSDDVPGLYLLAAVDICFLIENEKFGHDLHVWVSYFEIYCGQLFDLLNKRKRLQAREDGCHKVCIAGLTETEILTVSSLMQILDYGNTMRSKGSTGVNPDSSRSHAILQLQVRDKKDQHYGKISFIDLAGCERAADIIESDKQSRLEGAEINQSLLALKECIRSIDQVSRHTPFRQSKLTHILKDSFVGNAKTCMIANISPALSATEYTLNTLRYADRVKELRKEVPSPKSVRRKTSAGMQFGMNILSSVPHSVFHPSNITCSSTPIRSQHGSQHLYKPEVKMSTGPYLDCDETPIKGHRIPRKVSGKFNILPNKVKVAHGYTWDARDNVVNNEAYEDTDTESCNICPAYGEHCNGQVNHCRSSSDTDKDFSTTDFNYNLNDLNNPSGEIHKETKYEDSEASVSVSLQDSSGMMQVLQPVIKSKDELREGSYCKAVSLSGSKVSESTVYYKDSPIFEKAYKSESFDEDLLFGDPEYIQALKAGKTTEMTKEGTVQTEYQPTSQSLQRKTHSDHDSTLCKVVEPLVTFVQCGKDTDRLSPSDKPEKDRNLEPKYFREKISAVALSESTMVSCYGTTGRDGDVCVSCEHANCNRTPFQNNSNDGYFQTQLPKKALEFNVQSHCSDVLPQSGKSGFNSNNSDHHGNDDCFQPIPKSCMKESQETEYAHQSACNEIFSKAKTCLAEGGNAKVNTSEPLHSQDVSYPANFNPNNSSADEQCADKKFLCPNGFYPINPISGSGSSKPVLYPVPLHIVNVKKELPQDVKNHLIKCHEKQLAAITCICKQEMKFLQETKRGSKNFTDFIEKVDRLLGHKMEIIKLLQNEIQLCTENAESSDHLSSGKRIK